MLSLRTHSDRLNVALLALIVSLPLGNQLLTNICLALLGVQTLMIAKVEDWKRAITNPIVYSSILFFAVLTISLLWSEDRSEGVRQIETKLSFLVVPLFIAAGQKSWRVNLKSLALKAFVIGNVLAICIALAYATWRSIEAGAPYVVHEFGTRYFFLYTHLSLPIMHPGYMATYVGLALLICIHFFFQYKEKNLKIIYASGAVAFFIIMIMLQARINLIAIALVLGIGLVRMMWIKRSKRVFIATAIGMIAMIAFVFAMPSGMKKRYLQVPDLSYDISGDDFNSATFRLAIWKCTSAVIVDQPIIGTGIGDNRDQLRESYETHQFWQGVDRGFNSHNQFLEVLVSTGILGLTALLILFGSYFKAALSSRNLLLISALAFFIICILTESMFERVWGVQLFTVLFSVMREQPGKAS